MKARLVVFPVKGRNWCFSRSIDSGAAASQSSNTPSTLKDLWRKLFSSSPPGYDNRKGNSDTDDSKVELVVDFVSNKMNKAWTNLEKAPEGTFKNKIHGLGLKLLSRVKPSEILFKSIPKELKCVEITYPLSLNPRLVRRRLRHIALRLLELYKAVYYFLSFLCQKFCENHDSDWQSDVNLAHNILETPTVVALKYKQNLVILRGSVIHTQYFYGSAILLPLTSVFMVLPLPNIPFFWILFRTYSHWRASKGSEKLLHLVTDDASSSLNKHGEMERTESGTTSDSNKGRDDFNVHPWALDPSEELDEFIHRDDADGLSKCSIKKICEKFKLNTMDVVKYQDSLY